MTTAVAMNAKEVIAQGVSLVQDIPLSRIKESKTNPRRQIDETKLAELVQGIWMERGKRPRPRGVAAPWTTGPLRARLCAEWGRRKSSTSWSYARSCPTCTVRDTIPAGACERFQSHSLCHTL